MNILCVLWKGEFRRNGIKEYSDKDVDLLEKTVRSHLDCNYEMYCLTNDMKANIDANKIELKNNWPGWFSLMEMFRKDLPKGKTLLLGLDSYILNDLVPVFEYEDDLVLMETIVSKQNARRRIKRDKRMRSFKYNTGMVLINSTKFSWIYDKFLQNSDKYIRHFRGIDDILSAWLGDNIAVFPKEWIQRFRHIKKGKQSLGEKTILLAGDKNYRDLSEYPQIKKRAYER